MLTRALQFFVLRQLWSVGLLLLWLVSLVSSTNLDWNVTIVKINGTAEDHVDFAPSSWHQGVPHTICSSCYARGDADTTPGFSENDVTDVEPEGRTEAERNVTFTFMSA